MDAIERLIERAQNSDNYKTSDMGDDAAAELRAMMRAADEQTAELAALREQVAGLVAGIKLAHDEICEFRNSDGRRGSLFQVYDALTWIVAKYERKAETTTPAP